MSIETLDVFAGRLAGVELHIRRAVRSELVATMKDAEGRSQSLAGERLESRTGALLRSIEGEVTDTAEGFDLKHRVGARGSLRYGRLQELGGTVLPKKGRFLAIPTGAALTPAGVPRFPGGPRTAGPLRFISIRGGAMGLLVRDVPGRGKAGNGARSEVLYRLVPRVNVKAKHYMRDGFDGARAGLDARLHARVSTAFARGSAGGQ